MYSAELMKQRNRQIWIAIALGVVAVFLFVFFYIADPFPPGMTDLVTTGMTTFAALIAAVVSSLVWRRYGKKSAPRRVWLPFSIALWLWFIAEAIFFYRYAIDGDYVFSPADFFWVVAYLFFAVALFHQYAIIYRPRRIVGVAYFVLAFLAAALLTYLYALWLASLSDGKMDLETVVNAIYVVGDFSLALGALLLVAIFRDGAMGRAWLGLVAFTFSDLLYSLLEALGLYSWRLNQGDTLTLLSDSTYFAAYLIVAFGCYLQWILLSYGPRLLIVDTEFMENTESN